MKHFRTVFACALLGVLALPVSSLAQFVAEQVTIGNAATHLFQGSDADGGIGDWYLSNGVVEVIVDEIGLQTMPGGAPPVPKQSEIGFTGGTIIDAGLVGSDNDQLGQLFVVGGLSTSNFVLYDSIGGATTAGDATITVTGTLLGFGPAVPPADLLVTTTYTAAGTDNFITIRTTVENVNPTNTATGLGGLLDVFAWVTRAVVPFSPLDGRGFTHNALNLANPLPSLETPVFIAGPGNLGPDDGVMDPPSGKAAGEVAYGLLGVSLEQDPDAGGPTPPTVSSVDDLFGISNNLITAMGNPLAGSLAAGASFTYTRRVYIGGANDVAAVANSMITELGVRHGAGTGTISGDVDAVDNPDVAASAVATMTAGPESIPGLEIGAPITHFRTDATGAYSGVVLPEGTYDITFKSPERDDVTVSGVVVAAALNTIVPTANMTTEQGFAEISFFKSVPGVGKVSIPGRATFIGINGTLNPRFNDDVDAFVQEGFTFTDLNEESFAGGLAQRNFAYVGDVTGTVALRPGKYTVYGSHGPEYTLKRKNATIKVGSTKKLKFKLKHIVPTPDAMSADFHVHSGRSFDTSPPLEDRVISFAAEQVEVMVATDHDYHTDYSTVIAGLGLTGITSIVGNEVTGSVPNPPAFPDSIGHINAWPLVVDPDARRDGSIEDEFVAPNLVYSRLRAQGAEVIQYNHPRAGLSGITSIGFFNNFGYDPDVVVTNAPNDLLLDDDVLGPGISGVANVDGYRNIDFDVMEIMNEVDLDSYLEMRRDWFSLLNQYDGTTVPFIGGTSVSDSHRVTTETAGYGRTYVLGVGDDPSLLNVSTMNTNIKAGKMVGTTGPFIEFTVEDTGAATAGIGDTFDPATGDVQLNIKVTASHWIPVQEVRIYVNGFLDSSYNSLTTPAISKAKTAWSGSKKSTRFETAPGDITLSLSADSWIIVEAGQTFSPGVPIGVTGQVVPGLESVAFTNPIFIDLDGDGFDPPGLPVGPIPRQAAPQQRYSIETLDLSTLSETKHHQVTGHLPIHKITIPVPVSEPEDESSAEPSEAPAKATGAETAPKSTASEAVGEPEAKGASRESGDAVRSDEG